jgi:hypothetical protein
MAGEVTVSAGETSVAHQKQSNNGADKSAGEVKEDRTSSSSTQEDEIVIYSPIISIIRMQLHK